MVVVRPRVTAAKGSESIPVPITFDTIIINVPNIGVRADLFLNRLKIIIFGEHKITAEFPGETKKFKKK
jgi:hypothetical protein